MTKFSKIIASATLLTLLTACGGKLTHDLNDADVDMAYETRQDALENGESFKAKEYANGVLGTRGYVIPMEITVHKINGKSVYCRSLLESVSKNGETVNFMTRFCRSSDGVWR